MKKAGVLTTTFTLVLFLLVSSFIDLQTAKAQPRISSPAQTMNDEPYSYGINISSPTNTTYNSNSLLLNVTVRRPVSPNDYEFKIIYSLNGDANVTLPSTATFYDKSTPDNIQSFLASYTLAKGVASLSNLSEGSYYLTVYGIYEHRGPTAGTNWPAVMHDIQTVYFLINDGVPPSIKTLQIQNVTYENILPLNFSVDDPISWMGYSLDEKANVTFTGNTTLSGLAYGSHVLAVYANDTFGNMGTTGNLNFTIANPVPFPTVQTVPVAFVLFAIVIVAAASLLFFHKKHKR
jgi:hypothetical protein